MRLMIAGATGAIGRPLIRCLRERGHAVFALARSPESARAVAASGAEPVIADPLDAAAVKTALGDLWSLGQLRQIVGDGEPRRLARDVDMLRRPNAGFIVECA